VLDFVAPYHRPAITEHIRDLGDDAGARAACGVRMIAWAGGDIGWAISQPRRIGPGLPVPVRGHFAGGGVDTNSISMSFQAE
jgi:hypothetical protein